MQFLRRSASLRSTGLSIEALFIFAAIGCGGSNEATNAIPNSPDSIKVGEMSVQLTGRPKPEFSVSSGGVTVSGIYGAKIAYLSLYCPQVLSNTHIAFVRGGQIWIYDPRTGQSTEISNIPASQGISGGPSWSPAGTLVFSTVTASGTPSGSTYTCLYDGTNLKTLPTGANSVVQRPAFSPDGSHIAGYDASGNLCVESSSGQNQTKLVSSGPIDQIGSVGWLNTTTVVFQEGVSGSEQLFTIADSAGSQPSQLTNFNNTVQGKLDLQAAVSPSGNSVAFVVPITNSVTSITTTTVQVLNIATGAQSNITPTNSNYQWPSFAPSSGSLTFTYQDVNGVNEGSYGVYTSYIDGEQPIQIAADPVGQGGPLTDQSSAPSWQPFPAKPYPVVATTGGFLGSSSSGFFQAQVSSNAFPNVLSYIAQTPSTVQVTQPTSTSGSLVFSVSADSIRSISWENGAYLQSSSITPTGTSGFLVSVDSQTGFIGLVAPFIHRPPIIYKGPWIKGAADQHEYKGTFLAVFDRNGKNLAPNGAISLSIDSATGAFLACH